MNNEIKGREFTHAGIIINKNHGKYDRYRFLMKRKDSSSDKKYMSDVTLSKELLYKILTDTSYIRENYCYMQRMKFEKRFELVKSEYTGTRKWNGLNFYHEQIITLRDNKTKIEYIFNTNDRYQEVGLDNIPKASQYVKTIRYEDIDFESASLIKANYPIDNMEQEKEVSFTDIWNIFTQSEKDTIIGRIKSAYDNAIKKVEENKVIAKFYGAK